MRLVLSVVLPLALMTLLFRSAVPGVLATPTGLVRQGGYGISVGPWLPSRPDLLNMMNMDWVKIYATNQLRDYPNQYVLYRIEFDHWPDDAWVRGMYDLARELSAAGVDAVEIGNEPNLSQEWQGQPNAAHFTQGLCAAYRAFKEVAPRIVVVSGGLAPTAGTPDGMNIPDLTFAQQMFDNGAAACFDAWGYHPYGFNQPPEVNPYSAPFSFRRAELMYNLLLRNGVYDRQMWITEFGWVRNPAEEGLDCSRDPNFVNFAWMAVSRDTQADYTARAIRFADQNWPWAGPLFLWNLNWNLYTDPDYEPPCSHMRWYSILNRDGSLLPVVYALQRVIPPRTLPGPPPELPPGQQAEQPPEQPAVEYRPSIGAVVHRLIRMAEAGCAGIMRLGSFTVYNSGYPGHFEVEIEPVNAPGRPYVWTSVTTAQSGDEVEVYVDARGTQPGLYLIAINLRAFGAQRMSSRVVRGWLLIHHPSTPECVAQFGGSP